MTTAIAAAVAIVPSTLAGVGIAIATGKAAESIARQPEAAGQIRSSMLIGLPTMFERPPPFTHSSPPWPS